MFMDTILPMIILVLLVITSVVWLFFGSVIFGWLAKKQGEKSLFNGDNMFTDFKM